MCKANKRKEGRKGERHTNTSICTHTILFCEKLFSERVDSLVIVSLDDHDYFSVSRCLKRMNNIQDTLININMMCCTVFLVHYLDILFVCLLWICFKHV